MYAYQDQYGWTVAAYSDAPRRYRVMAMNSPRTFESREAAEQWIREQP